jgi:hypothetical protein
MGVALAAAVGSAGLALFVAVPVEPVSVFEVSSFPLSPGRAKTGEAKTMVKDSEQTTAQKRYFTFLRNVELLLREPLFALEKCVAAHPEPQSQLEICRFQGNFSKKVPRRAETTMEIFDCQQLN